MTVWSTALYHQMRINLPGCAFSTYYQKITNVGGSSLSDSGRACAPPYCVGKHINQSLSTARDCANK
jgi:hypothetical protein